MGRRAFAQSLAQVDAYSGPEDLFAYGAQPFIDEGKRKAAIDRAAMAFDGLREAEEDRMRELMDDDRDDEQLLPGHGDPAHVERTPFH